MVNLSIKLKLNKTKHFENKIRTQLNIKLFLLYIHPLINKINIIDDDDDDEKKTIRLCYKEMT